MRVAFVHPDLGIGGAERLVVDAAVGLQSRGHDVTVYTSHHDRTHCFEETRDGTLDVLVRGDWLPRSFFGKAYIVCAIIRNIYLAIAMLASAPKYDIIIVDQLSVSIPLFRFTGSKILFYCHFPDKLLSKKGSFLKTLYRMPIDFTEEITTRMSDAIVVNSGFTRSVFTKSFPTIKTLPDILYPGIRIESYDQELKLDDSSIRPLKTGKKILLSINRFERKKNINLAVKAFAALHDLCPKEFPTLQLVIAGGYDTRVTENVEHLIELKQLAESLNLTTTTVKKDDNGSSTVDKHVLFVPSFTEAQRTYLLREALCLFYTPSGEHFGIVPVEAMYGRLPVIAVNDGGPVESILDGETGFLREPREAAFASAAAELVKTPRLKKDIGENGRKRVLEKFTLEAFVVTLDKILESLRDKNTENFASGSS
ncbi:Alpha-1,3-mannosyltransferase-like protein [Blyttiomyces sp. JEL0837]|nr:Alpha-1,3-mannosyltransferase-like protein [Blyttiomyces sp. JEL0837]